MTVAIVSDGAAALPDGLARELGVTVVPMRLEEADRSTTSAPTPGDFEAAVRARLADGADAVVIVTLTAQLSASWQSAMVAARGADGAVVVVDSGSAAGGQALVVQAAAHAAMAGASATDVAARAQEAAADVALVGMVPDLSALVASGRVPAVAGWAGRRLGVQPLFELRRGRVRRLRPARGAEAAVDRMVRRVRTSRPATSPASLETVVLHAGAPVAASALQARVDSELAPTSSFVAGFGPELELHTGPGILGIAWRWETANGGT